MDKGLLILAQDDQSLRGLYSIALRGSGYEVTACAHGQDLFRLLVREVPRILLLDLMNPPMDPAELVKRARSMVADHIPVLFLTAGRAVEPLQACMLAGATDFLIATEDIETIIARVDFWATAAPELVLRRDDPDAPERKPKVKEKPPKEEPEKKEEEEAAAPSVVPTPPDLQRQQGRLNEVINRARVLAGRGHGRTSEEKIFFLGYLSGMADQQGADDFRLRPSYRENLFAALQASGVLRDPLFVDLLLRWQEVCATQRFLDGLNAGRSDWVRARTEGPYRLLGLAQGLGKA